MKIVKKSVHSGNLSSGNHSVRLGQWSACKVMAQLLLLKWKRNSRTGMLNWVRAAMIGSGAAVTFVIWKKQFLIYALYQWQKIIIIFFQPFFLRRSRHLPVRSPEHSTLLQSPNLLQHRTPPDNLLLQFDARTHVIRSWEQRVWKFSEFIDDLTEKTFFSEHPYTVFDPKMGIRG